MSFSALLQQLSAIANEQLANHCLNLQNEESVPLIGDIEWSPPAQNPRLDTTTRPNNAQLEVLSGEYSRQATFDAQAINQVNNQSSQVITVSLQCPASGCSQVFVQQDQLNEHLMGKHLLGPFRCALKDCGRSFDESHILREHINHAHKHTAQWHCSKCPKSFTTYQLLSRHNYQFHLLGHFQCAFPTCTFSGNRKAKVFNHYAQRHKQELKCQLFGCRYQCSSKALLKVHQRIHLGIKPYRCKWTLCDYAAVQKCHTIGHIRAKHLKRIPNGAALDPNDYLEVVHHLL